MLKKEIKIKLSDDNFQKSVALGEIMGLSLEKLCEKAVQSYLFTLQEHLNGIGEHILQDQIMFE